MARNVVFDLYRSMSHERIDIDNIDIDMIYEAKDNETEKKYQGKSRVE